MPFVGKPHFTSFYSLSRFNLCFFQILWLSLILTLPPQHYPLILSFHQNFLHLKNSKNKIIPSIKISTSIFIFSFYFYVEHLKFFSLQLVILMAQLLTPLYPEALKIHNSSLCTRSSWQMLQQKTAVSPWRFATPSCKRRGFGRVRVATEQESFSTSDSVGAEDYYAVLGLVIIHQTLIFLLFITTRTITIMHVFLWNFKDISENGVIEW